jgi:predicted Zn-dependent peptidase
MSLMLNEVFGKLQNVISPLALPDMQATPAQEKKYRIENDPKAVQGAIRIASPFPNRHHPDFQKVIVLNTLFGGFFGSRLMSNIREIKGYTYGIYSYLQNHLQQSAWVISTEAGKKVCEATINEVYLEMKALRENTIEEEELLHLMAKWKNILLNNLDENYFYDSVETIKTVTATELQTLAVKYMQPELFYELVVY